MGKAVQRVRYKLIWLVFIIVPVLVISCPFPFERDNPVDPGSDKYRVPDTPNLSTPIDGATIIDTTPALDWSDVQNAETFEVQVSDANDFSNIVESASGLSSSEYQVTTVLSNNTTYYWRARTYNADNVAGDWSSVFSFTVNIGVDLDIEDQTGTGFELELVQEQYSVLADNPISIVALTSEPVDSITWYVDGQSMSGWQDQSVVDFSESLAGQYSVTAVAEMSDYILSQQISIEVTNSEPTTVDLTLTPSAQSVQTYGSVTIDASATDTIDAINWYVNGASVESWQGQTSVTFSDDTPGQYEITATIESGDKVTFSQTTVDVTIDLTLSTTSTSVMPDETTTIGIPNVPFESIRWYVNGQEIGQWYNQYTIDFSRSSEGEYNVSVTFIYENDSYTDDIVIDVISSDFYDFEGGSISQDFSGDWIISNTSYSGNYSIMNRDISHNSTSSISLSIVIPDDGSFNVSFWHRVSSESSYDYLRFYVNGNQQVRWSGNGTWEEYSLDIDGTPAESIELTWSYTKDGSVSNYEDTVYVDDISINY